MTAFNREQQCRMDFKSLNLKNKDQSREHSTGKFALGRKIIWKRKFICFTIHLLLLSHKQMDYGHLDNQSLLCVQAGSVQSAGLPECLGKFSIMESCTALFSPLLWAFEFCIVSRCGGFKYLTPCSSSKKMFTQFL